MNKLINSNNLDYLIHFCIGGLLFIIIKYCSNNHLTKITALIPTIPILGIYGLFMCIKNKENLNTYLLNISNYILIALGFYILILIINKFIKKIFISLIISLIIWFIVVYYFVLHNF